MSLDDKQGEGSFNPEKSTEDTDIYTEAGFNPKYRLKRIEERIGEIEQDIAKIEEEVQEYDILKGVFEWELEEWRKKRRY